MNPHNAPLQTPNTKRIYNNCTPIPIHKISLMDDKTNRLGVMGANICCELNNNRCKKGYVLPYLTGLRLDYGWHLDRDLPNERGIGDTSWLYAVNENGEEDRDKEHYLSRFRIVNDDGFWQMYLLYIAENVMRAWWHGLYIMRGYIFTLSDIQYIKNMYDSDKETLSENRRLLPKIYIKNRIATIKATYWSDHKGLCQETVKIAIDEDGRLKSIKKISTDILIPNHVIFCY